MAKLTAAQRNALPSSEFAEPAERKFPINDASHARNALSRASHKGGSTEAKVDSKVHKKFPAIGHSAMGSMEHSGSGHTSAHHGGHHTVNVHLHMGKSKKKFSL